MSARVSVPAWEQELEAGAEDARYRLGDEVECDVAAERAVSGGEW